MSHSPATRTIPRPLCPDCKTMAGDPHFSICDDPSSDCPRGPGTWDPTGPDPVLVARRAAEEHVRDLADYQESKKARWLMIPIEMARDLVGPARKHIETARGADLDAIGTRAGCRRVPGLPDAQYRQAIKDVQRQQRGPAFTEPEPPLTPSPAMAQLHEAADAKYAATMQRREELVEAFIAETGLRPSECELVERVMGDGEKRVSVRQPGTTHEVTGCADCPFVLDSVHESPTCLLQLHQDPASRRRPPDTGPWLTAGAPDWCPLRNGPVTVRLKP